MDENQEIKIFSIYSAIVESIYLFFKSVNAFYLGLISIIFGSIFFAINYFRISSSYLNGLSNMNSTSSKYLSLQINSFVSHNLNIIILVIIIAIVYLLVSIYFTSISSAGLINYVIKGDMHENFNDSWRYGKSTWVDYFVFLILYYLIYVISFFILLLLISFLTIIVPPLGLILLVLLILSIFIAVPLSSIGVRLVIDRKTDIVEAIKNTYISFWKNIGFYLKVILFYLLVLILLSLIFSYGIEFLIIIVTQSLFRSNIYLGITSGVIGIFIVIYISAFINVFSSAFWSKVYVYLRDNNHL